MKKQRKKVKGVWNWKPDKDTGETTLLVKYFSITTKNPEEFLTEMDKVCQKFAVKEDDKGLAYGYNWEAQ